MYRTSESKNNWVRHATHLYINSLYNRTNIQRNFHIDLRITLYDNRSRRNVVNPFIIISKNRYVCIGTMMVICQPTKGGIYTTE